MSQPRYLESIIKEICFQTGKMAFVSGPRQCGKTTMAKSLLKERGNGHYYNWDETKFRRLWTKDPMSILPESPSLIKNKPLIILDELHKAKFWKRSLKGLYDSQNNVCDILVTGSARLNVYRKGSDSLMGRYYNFRLHPFSVAEFLKEQHTLLPNDLITILFQNISHSDEEDNALQKLYQFGPFPDPLFLGNPRTLNLWRRNRIEKIIREDLRDLSRLTELSHVEMLASLLPERCSQPLSIKGLSEDLEVAYTTVKRWLLYLSELYYIFTLKPLAKSLPRALKKENKLYLWDWSEIENPGARFENLIAMHLLKYCHYLTDSGYDNFDLRHFKNKEKNEIDFILLKNNKVFLPIEVKLSEDKPIPFWHKIMPFLKCLYGVQLVMQPKVYKVYHFDNYKILVISASTFLKYLI